MVKFILSILLGLGVFALFGQKGIFGISSVALVVALSSINPTLYLSLVNDIGKEEDPAAFGLKELFSIPVASYMTSATAQLLTGVVVTSLLTSFLVKRLHSKNTERQANK